MIIAGLERGQSGLIDEDFDFSRRARLSGDEAGSFERQHHLMHGWRRRLEKARHIGLRGRTAVDERIGVNEGEVLALS